MAIKLTLALIAESSSLNCLKQSYPQYYFADSPKLFEKDEVSIEIQTLVHLQDTNNLLIAGSYLRKIPMAESKAESMAEKMDVESNAFYFRLLENGTNDNFKLLDYASGITRIQQAKEVLYLFTETRLSLSYLRQQFDRFFVQKYFEI